jgi:hypothetical protein
MYSITNIDYNFTKIYLRYKLCKPWSDTQRASNSVESVLDKTFVRTMFELEASWTCLMESCRVMMYKHWCVDTKRQ